MVIQCPKCKSKTTDKFSRCPMCNHVLGDSYTDYSKDTRESSYQRLYRQCDELFSSTGSRSTSEVNDMIEQLEELRGYKDVDMLIEMCESYRDDMGHASPVRNYSESWKDCKPDKPDINVSEAVTDIVAAIIRGAIWIGLIYLVYKVVTAIF